MAAWAAIGKLVGNKVRVNGGGVVSKSWATQLAKSPKKLKAHQKRHGGTKTSTARKSAASKTGRSSISKPKTTQRAKTKQVTAKAKAANKKLTLKSPPKNASNKKRVEFSRNQLSEIKRDISNRSKRLDSLNRNKTTANLPERRRLEDEIKQLMDHQGKVSRRLERDLAKAKNKKGAIGRGALTAFDATPIGMVQSLATGRRNRFISKFN